MDAEHIARDNFASIELVAFVFVGRDEGVLQKNLQRFEVVVVIDHKRDWRDED